MGLELKLHNVSRESLGRHIVLAKSEYPNSEVTNIEHLVWKYIDNPQGAAWSHELYEDSKLIGKVLCQNRIFTYKGKTLRGGYLVDLLIHPEKRGIRHFLKLMGQVHRVKDLDFVFATPNDRSAPLYRQVLRFEEPFHLDALACPLEFRSIIKRIFEINLPVIAAGCSLLWRFLLKLLFAFCGTVCKLNVRETPPSEADFNETIGEISHSEIAIGKRDYEFHRWRFEQYSPREYRVYYLYTNSSQFVGYFAVREMHYEGFHCLLLIDILVATRLTLLERLYLLLKIVSIAEKKACDLVFSLLSLSNPLLNGFWMFPFIRVPERFLPQEVPVFVASCNDLQLPDFGRKELFLTMADMDVF